MNNDYSALVVGASRGIGLAITLRLLTETKLKRVYATYRNADSASGLLALNHEKLMTLPTDVTDEISIKKLASHIKSNQDQPKLVIHCAGILHEDHVKPEKALSQCKPDALLRIFDVNSIGPLMMAKAIIPLMPKQDPGQFAVLSAMVGSIEDNRLGGWYGYRASKAALNQFMRTLAIECRRTHPFLCITSIHPGTTDTDLSSPFQSNVEPHKLYTATQSAERIIDVVSTGQPQNSGRFVNWDGGIIPW